ncbi:hypothetical protein GCM10018954_037350 [Kutzneria kofuensis]
MTVAALAGAVALGVTGTAVAFAADGTRTTAGDVGWCTGHDLQITARDAHSPNSGSKLFRIAFAARDGVTCKIGGGLSNVRFLDEKGQDMNVPLNGGHHAYVELPVDASHEATVYVASQSEGPMVHPASIRFDLPGQGSLGDEVTVAWPSGLGARVRITDLMAPVS